MNERAAQLTQARCDIVKALSVLMVSANRENTLASRNFLYHADELLTWMDAFLGGRDPEPDPDDGIPG